jgi:hypothetical protein
LSYRGNSEQEALKNLTQNVRERLAEAGLSSILFEATAQGGKKYESMTLNIDVGSSPEERVKAWVIIRDEISKFFKERHMRG